MRYRRGYLGFRRADPPGHGRAGSTASGHPRRQLLPPRDKRGEPGCLGIDLSCAARLMASATAHGARPLLIVVMCAWLFDIALSAVIGSTRYDLGFYAGRSYGLVAASFVLMMLIIETGGLHSRLAAATAQLEGHARGLEGRVREQTEELHRANRELTAIIEASPVAIYMVDHEGGVTLWKASAERVFGYTEGEALGRLPPYLIEEHLADFRGNLARAVNDVSATGSLEAQRRRKDGKIIDVLIHWARVYDEARQRLGIMYAVADITERKIGR